MSVEAPVSGRVAQVISDRSIAINRGRTHGVKLGMLFQVLDPSPSPIIDPDNGEEIGSVGRTKAQVKVTGVYDRWSIATTFRIVSTGTFPDVSSLFDPTQRKTEVERLQVERTLFTPDPNFDRTIRVGDPVAEIQQTSST